jgi:DNA ligase (NAD+)
MDNVNNNNEKKKLSKLKLSSCINNCYPYYKEVVEYFKKSQYNKIDISKLQFYLMLAYLTYSKGEVSPLSDSEFDELNNIHEYLTGYTISHYFFTGGKKASHTYSNLKGTISKVHFIKKSDKPSDSVKTHKSIEEWLDSSFAKLGSVNSVIQLTPKYDGVSVVFSFLLNSDKVSIMESAITRGDRYTNEGSDLTSQFRSQDLSFLIPENITTDKIGIKTEVCMSKSKFEEYVDKFRTESRKLSDPRSVISGIINANKIPAHFFDEYIVIIPLEFETKDGISFPEDSLGFTIKVSDYSKSELLNKIKTYIDVMSESMEKLDINCDGIVIRFLDKQSQDILGRDNDNCVNKFEVAYKFPPEQKLTTLLSVDFQVGLLGNITPVAKIKPVTLKNKEIKSISLGSMERFKSLNLRIGDTVRVKYEIIPYLDKCDDTSTDNNNPIIEAPDRCPCCGEPLTEELYCCENPKCSSRMIGKINNYCEKMNIVGIGPAIIETLFNAGILKTIADLYKLKEHKDEILNIDGFGLIKYKNMISSIKNKDEVSIDVLLGSIGIRSIGRSKFKKIMDIYNISDLFRLRNNEEGISKLSTIPGIGKNTASQIILGIQENKELIEFLMKNVNIVEKKGAMYNIVFSGIRNREFAKFLETKGFEIKDSVNRKTKMVIVQSLDTMTEKTKKAKELNIPVIDIISAYGLFNYKKSEE